MVRATRKELETLHADDFARAWAIYLRPEKKAAAFDAYIWAMQNFNEDGSLPQRILSALTWQARQTPAQYWTRFGNWLLEKRWEDEPLRQVAVFEQDDPMYTEYAHWQRSTPGAESTPFEDFKRYMTDRRAGRVQ